MYEHQSLLRIEKSLTTPTYKVVLKGRGNMVTAVIIFVLISIGLILFAKWADKNIGVYDTIFCRNVRAQMGMFAYKSHVEATRKRLNQPNSKF